jgi:hypothetical protein
LWRRTREQEHAVVVTRLQAEAAQRQVEVTALRQRISELERLVGRLKDQARR